MNYNLPLQIRYLNKNILLAGLIPGPKNYKNLDSYLFSLIQEFQELDTGIPGVRNRYTGKVFTLYT